MSPKSASVPLHVYDPRRGDVPFKVRPIKPGNDFREPQRFNYFTIAWITGGMGTLDVDLHACPFAAPALLFLNPYQIFRLRSPADLHGVALQFHANFLCIETYHDEIGCNGVLFNDNYGQPVVEPDAALASEFQALIAQMENELGSAGLAHSEILLSYLKVFLIKATRFKLAQPRPAHPRTSPRPGIIDRLFELIELHYREKHTPAEYAVLLNITPKALGKLVRTHLGRTLTAVIRERVLKHAKWHLLHTSRPVKEIAAEAGFADELYFSRLFSRATGFSPTRFREFETAIRGGRNLSM